MIIGYLNYQISPVYYKVSMMVRHTELTTQTYGQMIGNLNSLVVTGSSETLARDLKLNPATAAQIRSITAEGLQGESVLRDTSSATDRSFIIRITVRKREIADTLQQALLNYFNNNPYISKLKQDHLQLDSTRLALIDGELRKVDSLTQAYTRSLSAPKGAASFYNNAFNSAELLKEFSKYAEERKTVEERLLNKRETLQMMDGVKPSIVPSSSNIISNIILYVVIFFFAGCVLGGMLELIKKPL